jgi:hypothetical protein
VCNENTTSSHSHAQTVTSASYSFKTHLRGVWSAATPDDTPVDTPVDKFVQLGSEIGDHHKAHTIALGSLTCSIIPNMRLPLLAERCLGSRRTFLKRYVSSLDNLSIMSKQYVQNLIDTGMTTAGHM